jgi:DNA-directed RNA polymerase specialized sigma24 family protein
MSTYQFWLPDTDETGKPYDPEILDAARKIGPSFFRFRERELGCESLANAFAQEAVAAVSKAKHGRPIENPSGYLVAVFTRKVNKFLARQAKSVAVDGPVLEGLMGTASSAAYKNAPIERHISMIEAMNAMDDEIRNIFSRRLMGYTMSEIADEQSVAPNYLSVRYSRGLQRTIKKLNSRPDGRSLQKKAA